MVGNEGRSGFRSVRGAKINRARRCGAAAVPGLRLGGLAVEEIDRPRSGVAGP